VELRFAQRCHRRSGGPGHRQLPAAGAMNLAKRRATSARLAEADTDAKVRAATHRCREVRA
jgi:hypothetical protein